MDMKLSNSFLYILFNSESYYNKCLKYQKNIIKKYLMS